MIETRNTRSRSGPSLCRVRTAGAACPLSELECLCGALGSVGEGGVLVQSDPLGRVLAAAGAERICRTTGMEGLPPAWLDSALAQSVDPVPADRPAFDRTGNADRT